MTTLDILEAKVAGLQSVQTAQSTMLTAVFQLLQDHQAKILELEARLAALEAPAIPESGELRLVPDDQAIEEAPGLPYLSDPKPSDGIQIARYGSYSEEELTAEA